MLLAAAAACEDDRLSSPCTTAAKGYPPMSRSVTIGSRPDCDLVVNVPSVSGHHCRLTRDGASYILEDLGSTNGTYLNGERVAGRVTTRLDTADTLHLGSHALALDQVRTLLGPEPAPFVTLKGAEMVIGRTSGCDHVIDLPMISSRHAQSLPIRRPRADRGPWFVQWNVRERSAHRSTDRAQTERRDRPGFVHSDP